MNKNKKTYLDILSGTKDRNMRFSDVRNLLDAMGFKCSINGDHYIFRMPNTPIINMQSANGKAKRYQIAQLRKILLQNGLEV